MSTELLAKKYQHKTEIEHILHRPNVYIGSILLESTTMWISNGAGGLCEKEIAYIPALYKLFDEGIVNCRDHVVRMEQSVEPDKKLVTKIDIQVSEDGTITMINDGDGLDIERHPETGLWIPEMIFGHLRTSTNYEEEEKKMVGGQNGLGFKLVLIWSTYGQIETVDHRRCLRYSQEFTNNLGEIREPIIQKVSKFVKPYTKIVFKPDYARFGLPISPDMISLFYKRTIDMSALTKESVKVTFKGIDGSGQTIPVKNFQQYVDLYVGKKAETKRVHEQFGERWELVVALSPSHEFQQVSFVNGICTYKGGKHVDYIMGKITRELVKFIEKKKKVKVNSNSIKEQLFLFLRCDIENPSFDSQVKDYLNTTSDKFGSTCEISEEFIEKIAKMGVMEKACSISEAKEELKIAKTTDGKRGRAIHIEKYCPANFAGTAKSGQCILILCEGDSAKSGVLSGLTKADRDTIGIYPLKGKVLNVRETDALTISKNKEITELKQILGLENGKEYKTIADVNRHLNYSKILILCDADVDGSHIKGLLINLFDCQWSSLLKINGFISYMNTPILRATKKGGNPLFFYHEGEFNEWKKQDLKGYTIKYFKGLGTSTSAEFKEYFANRGKLIVDYHHTDNSSEVIDMTFNKKRADDRKEWLSHYDKNAYLDTSRKSVFYEEFINKELIHFSIYNCERSIASVMDGLKPSQRKILFCALKRNLTTDTKVAQFSGYVSEHSAYHHGEASLQSAIIGMAQNYMGSNNINLLVPSGQFGTRVGDSDGSIGQDSASPRYIYTRLSPITRYIYRKEDDPVLTYLQDDGTPIEPEFYCPIIPMVLVNGSQGIGMGYSSEVVSYNTLQLIGWIKNKLVSETTSVSETTTIWNPFYCGFEGTITNINGDANKFLIRGKYSSIDENKIRITELPVSVSTNEIINILKHLSDSSLKDKNGKSVETIVKNYIDYNSDKLVDTVVEFIPGKKAELESNIDKLGLNGIEKLLKLGKTISTTNMYLFNDSGLLRKYLSVQSILDDYFRVRYTMYQTRKNYCISVFEQELKFLSNKARYILELLEDTISLRRKSDEEIYRMLSERGFDLIDDSYEYLLRLRMDSVSQKNVEKALQERDRLQIQLNEYREKTVEQIWLQELEELEQNI